MRYDEYFGGGSAAQPSATATPKPNTDIVIQWESEGDDVYQYQTRLAELGYLDTKYITEWTFGLDVKILFKTVISVVKRDGSM